MIKERIADNLRKLRKGKGLTQPEVARSISVHWKTYQNYELKYAQPSIEVLLRLAEYYCVTINQILE